MTDPAVAPASWLAVRVLLLDEADRMFDGIADDAHSRLPSGPQREPELHG